MSKELTARQKVEFLRAFMKIGHTEGKPFESACVTMYGRQYDLYPMSEVKEMLDEIMLSTQLGGLGSLSSTQRFVMHMLKDSGVIAGFYALSEYELSAESEGVDDD